jgi:hypothetical protein
MPQAELKQIRGIGDAICELLGRDHGIATIADLARLSDAEVDELQRALRASRRNVRNGDVAAWRDQARQLTGEMQAAADEPLATFVVEAWRPVSEPGDQPRFIVHHVEADETLETSAPRPTIDDVVRWMQERMTVPVAPPSAEPPAEHQQPARPARLGDLRITRLDPVAVEGGGALVFVAHVSLEGAAEPATCHLRCRLQRIESDQELTFSWRGEIMAAPGPRSAAISSAPISVPAGIYRGICLASDRRPGGGRAFRELPLLVVS